MPTGEARTRMATAMAANEVLGYATRATPEERAQFVARQLGRVWTTEEARSAAEGSTFERAHEIGGWRTVHLMHAVIMSVTGMWEEGEAAMASSAGALTERRMVSEAETPEGEECMMYDAELTELATSWQEMMRAADVESETRREVRARATEGQRAAQALPPEAAAPDVVVNDQHVEWPGVTVLLHHPQMRFNAQGKGGKGGKPRWVRPQADTRRMGEARWMAAWMREPCSGKGAWSETGGPIVRMYVWHDVANVRVGVMAEPPQHPDDESAATELDGVEEAEKRWLGIPATAGALRAMGEGDMSVRALTRGENPVETFQAWRWRAGERAPLDAATVKQRAAQVVMAEAARRMMWTAVTAADVETHDAEPQPVVKLKRDKHGVAVVREAIEEGMAVGVRWGRFAGTGEASWGAAVREGRRPCLRTMACAWAGEESRRVDGAGGNPLEDNVLTLPTVVDGEAVAEFEYGRKETLQAAQELDVAGTWCVHVDVGFATERCPARSPIVTDVARRRELCKALTLPLFQEAGSIRVRRATRAQARDGTNCDVWRVTGRGTNPAMWTGPGTGGGMYPCRPPTLYLAPLRGMEVESLVFTYEMQYDGGQFATAMGCANCHKQPLEEAAAKIGHDGLLRCADVKACKEHRRMETEATQSRLWRQVLAREAEVAAAHARNANVAADAAAAQRAQDAREAAEARARQSAGVAEARERERARVALLQGVEQAGGDGGGSHMLRRMMMMGSRARAQVGGRRADEERRAQRHGWQEAARREQQDEARARSSTASAAQAAPPPTGKGGGGAGPSAGGTDAMGRGERGAGGAEAADGGAGATPWGGRGKGDNGKGGNGGGQGGVAARAQHGNGGKGPTAMMNTHGYGHGMAPANAGKGGPHEHGKGKGGASTHMPYGQMWPTPVMMGHGRYPQEMMGKGGAGGRGGHGRGGGGGGTYWNGGPTGGRANRGGR